MCQIKHKYPWESYTLGYNQLFTYLWEFVWPVSRMMASSEEGLEEDPHRGRKRALDVGRQKKIA